MTTDHVVNDFKPPATAKSADFFESQVVAPEFLGLTPRQGDVLALVVQGLSNKRIALLLALSESTVKEHVSAILQRLGVGSRIQVITMLHRRRLVVGVPGLNVPPTAPRINDD